MIFRTQISSPNFPFSIHYQDRILSVGSCFAENMGQRLIDRKFALHLNPFGILYNPISILKCLKRLKNGRGFSESEIFENGGLYHSFSHHGSYSKVGREECLENINHSFNQSRSSFEEANVLLITLGTAHVFEYLKTGEIVANCHKVPNKEFRRRRLAVSEISEPFISFLKGLKKEKSNLNVVVTVSPIRHIRDGLEENQKSKATLLLAVDEIVQQLDFVHYFPAYEIVLDDLRDYRFYEKDMIHPNEMARDYIWEIFSNTLFDEQTKQIIQKVKKLKAAASHRPLFPNSEKHQIFQKTQLEKIRELERTYSFLDFSEERKVLSNFGGF